MPLSNKTVLLTGATGGLGQAMALQLAQQGARLVLGYCSQHEQARQLLTRCTEAGTEAALAPVDLLDPGAGDALCQAALDRFGQLDVLVNNAAAMADNLLAMLPDQDLDAMVATNITGLVRLTRAALRPMLRQRGGCIINLSSVLASRPARGNAVYAGTKGFVESFTRAMAVELGPKGVRVNAVAPGVVQAGMARGVLALAGDEVRQRVGLRRCGTPEEVAALVCFLASDQASYISGAVLPVDGAYAG